MNRIEMEQKAKKMTNPELLQELVKLGGLVSNYNALVDADDERFQAIYTAIEVVKEEMLLNRCYK